MNAIHVVTGAGPVGSTVAQQLAESGQRVRLLTRSGSGPEHPLVERRRVDVSRPEQLDAAFEGAVAVHHCIHGSRYDARTWRAELPVAERHVLAAAGRVGAVVVFPESLYSYGPVDGPITEDTPRTATTGKLGVRTELLAQRDASPTPTVSVAASDFYGPLVRNAHAGERLVPTVLAGPDHAGVGQPRPAALVHLRARPRRRDDPRRGDPRPLGLVPARAHRSPGHPARARRAGGGRGRGARPADVGHPGVGAHARWVRCRATPASWRRRRTCSPAPSCSTRRAARSASGWRPPRSATGVKETVAWWRTDRADRVTQPAGDLVAHHGVARRRRRLGLGRLVAGDRAEDLLGHAPHAREHGVEGRRDARAQSPDR